MKLAGKKIVAIGGTSGIGLAVAKAAMDEGAEVFAGSSKAANLDKAKASIGDRLSGATIDATDEASVAAFFE